MSQCVGYRFISFDLLLIVDTISCSSHLSNVQGSTIVHWFIRTSVITMCSIYSLWLQVHTSISWSLPPGQLPT